MVNIIVDHEKCTGCGSCVNVCLVGVYELQKLSNNEKSVPVHMDLCIECRACEAQCPVAIIKVVD